MSGRQLDRTPQPTARPSTPWLRRAWVGVALVPVAFALAFAAGSGVYAWMGYQPENADAPLWAVVVASTVVVLIVLIPCVAAVVLGRRAIKDGERRGVYPAVIGAVAGVAVVALTLASEIGNVVRG